MRISKRLSVKERKSQLIKLGLKIFSRRSFDSISTDDMAQMAGVSKGLLYHYFPSKRHYYVETIKEAARIIKSLTGPLENVSPEESLRHSISRFLYFIKKNNFLYVTLMRGGIGDDPEVHNIIEDVRLSSVERILKEFNIPDASQFIRGLIYGWIGQLEFTLLHWQDHHLKNQKGGAEESKLQKTAQEEELIINHLMGSLNSILPYIKSPQYNLSTTANHGLS